MKYQVNAWMSFQKAHEARADALTKEHRERRARGEKHAVEDFMFNYYRLSVAKLREWHPGHGVTLLGTDKELEEFRSPTQYRRTAQGLTLDSAPLMAKWRPMIASALNLLERTANRPARFGCFGLHEWAMVYGLEEGDQRHTQHPLRLGHDGTDAVVEAENLVCTHFDAYRFFTPEAVPRNRDELTRETQSEMDQPGCLHANMDLYRWASKFLPLVPSELVLDAFVLARDIRTLDMAASPYDLSEVGLEPVRIETTEGKARYAREQRIFSERSQVLRLQLIRNLSRLASNT